MKRKKYKPDAQARDREIPGNISSLARFEVAHLRQDFAFYLTKHVKIKKSEAFQYKPDAQAREQEILGNIRSLALRACIGINLRTF